MLFSGDTTHTVIDAPPNAVSNTHGAIDIVLKNGQVVHFPDLKDRQNKFEDVHNSKMIHVPKLRIGEHVVEGLCLGCQLNYDVESYTTTVNDEHVAIVQSKDRSIVCFQPLYQEWQSIATIRCDHAAIVTMDKVFPKASPLKAAIMNMLQMVDNTIVPFIYIGPQPTIMQTEDLPKHVNEQVTQHIPLINNAMVLSVNVMFVHDEHCTFDIRMLGSQPDQLSLDLKRELLHTTFSNSSVTTRADLYGNDIIQIKCNVRLKSLHSASDYFEKTVLVPTTSKLPSERRQSVVIEHYIETLNSFQSPDDEAIDMIVGGQRRSAYGYHDCSGLLAGNGNANREEQTTVYYKVVL